MNFSFLSVSLPPYFFLEISLSAMYMTFSLFAPYGNTGLSRSSPPGEGKTPWALQNDVYN